MSDGAVRVGVIGAAGRMGAETCRAVSAADDLELVAELQRGDSLDDLMAARAEVGVDFTAPDAVAGNVHGLIARRIHAVVGTTGLTEEDLDGIRASLAGGGTNVIVAPNFALGAVLMMRFAGDAAPYFAAAEIVERHHEGKKDAPSGTALRTAALMNAARSSGWPEPSGARESLPGARGGDAGGVRVHSLRLSGSVAHQEVILGAPGEVLTIRHDSLDRRSFMPGVLLAIRAVRTLPGLTVGLEHVLDATGGES